MGTRSEPTDPRSAPLLESGAPISTGGGGPAPRPRGAWWPSLAIVAAHLAAAWPLISSGNMRGRAAFDQLNYHEKVVRTFVQQWPNVDPSDYLSATTPLYHVLVAGAGKVLGVGGNPGAGVGGLQWAGAVFTCGLLALLARALSMSNPAPRALLHTLIVAASVYVFPAGVWLLPDNLAWLLVLGVLLIAWRARFDAILLLGGGTLLLLLVLTRQSHLWAAGVLWAGAWAAPIGKEETEADRSPGVGVLWARADVRLMRTMIMAVATLPAFAAVYSFYKLWGHQLYPPTFAAQFDPSPNPATPAFVLAVLGMYSAFFAGELLPRLGRLWRTARAYLLGVALAALALAIIPRTTYSLDAGRFSGLWDLAARFPSVQGRSVLITALATWGAASLLAWTITLPRRERLVVGVALAGFMAAMSTGHYAWQRYVEPFALLVLVLLAARAGRAATGRVLGLARVAGPALLAALMVGLSVRDVLRAEPAADMHTGIGHVPAMPRDGAR